MYSYIHIHITTESNACCSYLKSEFDTSYSDADNPVPFGASVDDPHCGGDFTHETVDGKENIQYKVNSSFTICNIS